MRKYLSYLAAGAFILSGAVAFAPTEASASSVSERICETEEPIGTWDKATKTCVYPTVETKPGNNKGKASWETESSDEAHGNLKNPKSDHNEECAGPGNSTSKC